MGVTVFSSWVAAPASGGINRPSREDAATAAAGHQHPVAKSAVGNRGTGASANIGGATASTTGCAIVDRTGAARPAGAATVETATAANQTCGVATSTADDDLDNLTRSDADRRRRLPAFATLLEISAPSLSTERIERDARHPSRHRPRLSTSREGERQRAGRAIAGR
jgi:hypothetical protein